jgi:hypothetical protein
MPSFIFFASSLKRFSAANWLRYYQASQKPINRIRISVVRTNHGTITTSTLSLRMAGMSLSRDSGYQIFPLFARIVTTFVYAEIPEKLVTKFRLLF